MQVVVSPNGSSCIISGTPSSAQVSTDHTITARNDSGESHVVIDITVIAEASFVTTWKTDNPGESEENQITITTSPNFTYSYTVNWGDGHVDNNLAGDTTHTYAQPGTYTVVIEGDFPQLYFNENSNLNDAIKLLSVELWGNQAWRSMANAFRGC